ncbi:MAG: P-loop NTPase fold protein [Candidatus Kapaibacterium sp.]
MREINIPMHSTLPRKNKSEDELNRYSIAEGIVSQIKNLPQDESLVIGLFGVWGEGKTTMINFIKDVIQKSYFDKFCMIDFNPWYYNNEDSLQLDLISELVSSAVKELGVNKSMIGRTWLQTKKLRLTKNLEKVEKISNLVKPTLKSIPVVGQIKGEIFGIVLEIVTTLLKNNSLQEAKNKLIDLLKDSKEGDGKIAPQRKKIVFIDDVDRLNSTEIYNIFRLIKNIGDLPNVIYVLAFDEYLVADALKQHFGGSDRLGATFIDKVIQLPVIVPPKDNNDLYEIWTKEIDKVCDEYSIELKEEDIKYSIPLLQYLKVFINTPRAIIKHVNSLRYALIHLKNEVNVIDLIVIEAIRAFLPSIYAVIRKHKEMMLYNTRRYAEQDKNDNQSNFKKIMDRITLDFSEFEVNNIYNILKLLFPYNVFKYEWSSESIRLYNNYKRSQRICTSEYFTRYFQYSIPEGQMPDVELNNQIKQIGMIDLNSGTHLLQELFRKNKQKSLIQWLMLHYDSFRNDILINIIYCSAHLPEDIIEFNPHQVASFTSYPLDIYVTFLKDCIIHLELQTQDQQNNKKLYVFEILTRFANECKSPYLLIELIYSFIDVVQPMKEPLTISESINLSLNQVHSIQESTFRALSKIQSKLPSPHLYYNHFSYRGFWCLQLWANVVGKEEMNRRLSSYFNQVPDSSGGFNLLFNKLVECLAPFSVNSDAVKNHLDFTEETASSVFKIVFPSNFIEWAKAQYIGEDFDNIEFQSLYRQQWGNTLGIVKQLAYFAQKLVSEEKEAN